MWYYINIGSNLGDRHLNIRRAVGKLREAFGPVIVSELVESEPWGFDSTNLFLNIGVAFDSALPPLEMLSRLQAIEKEISPASHRNPDGTYADRIIDIDIMEAEGVTLETPRLTLPHPRLQERPFFLIPLQQLKKLRGESGELRKERGE